jgi:hypothetical protein
VELLKATAEATGDGLDYSYTTFVCFALEAAFCIQKCLSYTSAHQVFVVLQRKGQRRPTRNVMRKRMLLGMDIMMSQKKQQPHTQRTWQQNVRTLIVIC